MACLSVMLSATLALASSVGSIAGDPITCKPTDPASCMCDGKPIGPDTWKRPSWFGSSASSLWELSADMDGQKVPLSKYKAKAALVVNVASACGFQYQNYPGFKRLMTKYGPLGFTLIAFPSNQFGAQATGSSECERAYMYHKLNETEGNFPIFDKTDVNGPQTSEVYAFLKARMFKGDDVLGDIAWNYEKFLVNGSGIPVHRISSATDPEAALEPTIRKLVGAPQDITV